MSVARPASMPLRLGPLRRCVEEAADLIHDRQLEVAPERQPDQRELVAAEARRRVDDRRPLRADDIGGAPREVVEVDVDRTVARIRRSGIEPMVAGAVDVLDGRARLAGAPAREPERRHHHRLPAGVADGPQVVRAAHRVAGLPVRPRVLEDLHDAPRLDRREGLDRPGQARRPARVGLGDVAREAALGDVHQRPLARATHRDRGGGHRQPVAQRAHRAPPARVVGRPVGLDDAGHQRQRALRVAVAHRHLGLAEARRRVGDAAEHGRGRPPHDGPQTGAVGHRLAGSRGPRIRSRPIRSGPLARRDARANARCGSGRPRPGRPRGRRGPARAGSPGCSTRSPRPCRGSPARCPWPP